MRGEVDPPPCSDPGGGSVGGGVDPPSPPGLWLNTIPAPGLPLYLGPLAILICLSPPEPVVWREQVCAAWALGMAVPWVKLDRLLGAGP